MRCKMVCHEVTANPHSSPENPMSNVRLGAVWSPEGNGENSVYGKYTPCAHFQAQISTPVDEKLVVGESYYVDFTRVEDTAKLS